jgi:hypothetical protein
MASQSIYDGIKHVVQVHKNIDTDCEHCSYKADNESFTESINHYISEHKYKLLHIGAETLAFSGTTKYYSVAFLGK